MIQIGIKGQENMVVGASDTALAAGSGTLEVLATPRVAALMEMTAWKSVSGELEPGTSTVGTWLSLEHLAPSPVGASIHCESELTAVNGRELAFAITACDNTGVIARAEHKRVIITTERFLKKASGRI